MRNVKKLTPEVIKQIIAEEKANVKSFLAKKMLKEDKNLLNKLRMLKKIDSIKPSSLNEQKQLDRLKYKIINSIKKRKK